MQHNDLWKAIDSLADQHGLSASGIARRAGLRDRAALTSDGFPTGLACA